MITLTWLRVLSIGGLCSSALCAQQPFEAPPQLASSSGLDANTLVAIPLIQDWTASPTGEAAAINVKTFNPDTKTTKHTLWLLPVNAQFTVAPKPVLQTTANTLFTWLSDTSLVILRPIGETSSWELVVTNVNYTITPPAYPPVLGPLRPLRTFPVLVQPKTLAFSKESGVLALVTNAYADEDLSTIPEQDQEDVDAGQGWTGGWVYEDTWPRHGDTWTRRKQPRLFLLDLHVEGEGLQARWTIEEGTRAPLVGTGIIPEEIKLSAHTVAVVGKDPKLHRAFHTRTNLYTVPLKSSEPPLRLSSGTGGQVSSPVLNGKNIAWLEQSQDGNIHDTNHVWIFDGVRKWQVILNYDLNPHRLEFSVNGEALFLVTEHETETSLYHIWVPSSSSSEPVHATLIPTNGTIHSTVHVGITPLKHSHFISLKSSLDSPPELYVTSHSPYDDPDGNLEEPRLTNFTLDATSALKLSRGETFWVVSEGRQVQGRIFLPEDVEKEGSVPLAVLLHEGHGFAWKNEWTSNWNPNVFVAAGYAVLQVNPSGSSGYSQEFSDSVRGEWGGKPIKDIKNALAHVLQHYSSIDRRRTFALGTGYGGYTVNWIQGHNKDFGFKAFVSQGGIFSTFDIAYEVDEVFYPEWEFKGLPGDAQSTYEQWNPRNHVTKWDTPTLVIHGGKDYRVGETQGIATYNALQSRGIPSRLLYFPTEGHVIENSENTIKWYVEVLRFLQEQKGLEE